MNLSNNLRISEGQKLTYDEACKNLSANRQLLATILHEFVLEFKESDRKDIETKYIEPDIQISSVAVEPGLTNIRGRNTEKIVLGEGTVYFDLLFDTINPQQLDKHIGIRINRQSPATYALIIQRLEVGA